MLYERNPDDLAINPESGLAVYKAACDRLGGAFVRHDPYTEKGSPTVFPVRSRDERIVSSFAASDVLQKLPLVTIDYVFVAPEKLREAELWLKEERGKIIAALKKEE